MPCALPIRSEEHTSELQSPCNLVCRLLLEKKQEITHGWSEWFETGLYQFTDHQPGGGWMWVGTHIRPRVAVLFFLMMRGPPRSTPFPYTPLFRSGSGRRIVRIEPCGVEGVGRVHDAPAKEVDRKSTRLNSSHLVISYAVFCLK